MDTTTETVAQLDALTLEQYALRFGGLIVPADRLAAYKAERRAQLVAIANREAILAAVALGFQTVGCNPHRLPGVELVAQGAGVLEPVWPAQLRAVDGAFVIFGQTFDGTAAAGERYAFPELARFETAAELAAWLATNGTPYPAIELETAGFADPRD